MTAMFFDRHPLIEAWLAGFFSGFLVSIPVGPINITIINEGAQRGFWRALFIGLGAVLMEAIYCTIGFAGFAGMFNSPHTRAALELVSFLLMAVLGTKYLMARQVNRISASADRMEHRLHPHTAFATGFVRVLGNPGVLLLWITLSATFTAHEWVDPNWVSKSMCISGVVIGASLWFTLLSYMVSLGHRKFSDRVMLRMSQASGACLLLLAVAIGCRLVMLLANRQ